MSCWAQGLINILPFQFEMKLIEIKYYMLLQTKWSFWKYNNRLFYDFMQKQTSENKKGLIYLLMGYFGSGKTTFIKNLLKNQKGKKYAIIQNEFASGQMGIQQPLIMDQTGTPFSSFLQLPNGCICCSAKNDLVAGIEYILQNTEVRDIVVQTNGLANPAQSIKQFWFDQQMKINGELHSVISIFSAQKFKTVMKEQIFQKQVIYANKALVTFIDKSESSEVTDLESYILQNNPQCQIAKNTTYDIIQFLQGPKLFDFKLANQIKLQNCGQQKKQNHKGIQSLFIKGNCSLSKKIQIQNSVGELLWQSGLKIYRVKGVFSLKTDNNVFQLQGVDDVFEVKQSKTSTQKYQNLSKILVIGHQISGKIDQIKTILKIE